MQLHDSDKFIRLQAHAKRCNGGCFAHRYYKFFNFLQNVYFCKVQYGAYFVFFNLLIPKM